MNEQTTEQPAADTPWGLSDGFYPVAEGITAYTTASHGGYRLSKDRQDNLAARGMPACWCREWYEEDCEVAAVILGFSGEFSPDMVRSALATANWLRIGTDYPTWAALWQWVDARREIKERARLDHTVTTHCPMCAEADQVHTKKDDYDRWRSGQLIQEAMPYLSIHEREQLQTGICGPCWDLYMVPSDD